jgi:hypothetical protein
VPASDHRRVACGGASLSEGMLLVAVNEVLPRFAASFIKSVWARNRWKALAPVVPISSAFLFALSISLAMVLTISKRHLN